MYTNKLTLSISEVFDTKEECVKALDEYEKEYVKLYPSANTTRSIIPLENGKLKASFYLNSNYRER